MTLRPSRYTTLALCVLVLFVATPFAAGHPWVAVVAGLALVLVLIGIRDLFQPQHSIRATTPCSATYAGWRKPSGRKSGNI